MIIRKIELYKFKRFFLSQVDHFILEPKSNIMIMAWGNGKGKSSLLSMLNPLPAELKRDFKEDGYKYIEILHRGHEYKLSSGKLEKNKHSFIYDGTELNPGGTKKVQLELVNEHFNITPNVNQILLGIDKFTSMSPSTRKEWFNKLSTIDYTYAIKVYNALKSRHRDLLGGIKLAQDSVVKLTNNLINDEELLILNQQHEELEEMITYIITLYEHTEGIEINTDIIKELNQTVNDFKSSLSKELPSYDIDYYTSTIAQLELKITTLENDIKNIQSKLELLEANNSVSNKSKEDLLLLRKQTIGKLLEYRKANIYNVNLYSINKIYATYSDLNMNLVSLVQELNDLDRVKVSLEKIQEIKDKITGIENSFKILERKETQIKGEIGVLEQFNKAEDIVTCPKCQERFYLHYKPDEIKLLVTNLERIEESKTKLSKTLDENQRGLELLIKIKTIIDNIHGCLDRYHILRPISNYVYTNIDYNTTTNNILSILDNIKFTLSYLTNFSSEYKTLKDIRKELNRLREIELLENQLNINNIEKLEIELDKKTHELVHARSSLEKANNDKKHLIRLNVLESKLKNILKNYGKLKDKAFKNLKNQHLNEVVNGLKEILIELDQRLLKDRQAKSQLEGYNNNITEYKEKEEVLLALIKQLSPTDGIIAKSINSFLNIFIQEMNYIINSVWSYEMLLLPCEVTEENDLDYKFKVKVNNDEIIEDVSKLSSSMQEIVDLAYKIVFMKYMHIEDTPLFLDEFGKTMDNVHRDTAYNIIDRVFTNNFNQIFLVSHFESMYGRFVNADIVQLEDTV